VPLLHLDEEPSLQLSAAFIELTVVIWGRLSQSVELLAAPIHEKFDG
jgi:hypothetical protein